CSARELRCDCRYLDRYWWEARAESASLMVFVGGDCRVSGKLAAGLDMFAGMCQGERMKKQASDQSFHDRRYQERKRAEAAKKAPKKKVDGAVNSQPPVSSSK